MDFYFYWYWRPSTARTSQLISKAHVKNTWTLALLPVMY